MKKFDVLAAFSQNSIEKCFRKLIWLGWDQSELVGKNLTGRGGLRAAIDQKKFKSYLSFTIERWNRLHPKDTPFHVSFDKRKKTMSDLRIQMDSLCQRATTLARKKDAIFEERLLNGETVHGEEI